MLVELPSGDCYINPKTVVGIRVLVDTINGKAVASHVMLYLNGSLETVIIDFESPEAARTWAKEFTQVVNDAD